MNVHDIFLCTGLSPVQAAERLADALGTTLRFDGEVPVVSRPVGGQWKDRASVGGGVYENYLADPDAIPQEQAVYDHGYDILYEVWVTRTLPAEVHEEVQEAEARKIFTELTERLPFPIIHAEEGGGLYAAWDPKRGRTDFPPGTSADAELGHRELWEPYAHPVAPRMM